MEEAATNTVRIADYDALVDDGDYNVTHLQGVMTIVQDVS